MSKELLQQAIDFAEYCLEELELSYMASNQAKRLIEKSEEALAKQEQLGEPVAFFDWYDNAHWGNEDFKESCHRSWNAAIKYTTPQPKQEQGEPVAWKLVPIEPTREMLDAMDECSMEGYDERLYAGHAASVYMAAVDVAPTQPQRKEPEQEPWVCECGADSYLACKCAIKSTSQPKESEQEDYLSKAYRLANELLCHLAIAPAPQRTWVELPVVTLPLEIK